MAEILKYTLSVLISLYNTDLLFFQLALNVLKSDTLNVLPNNFTCFDGIKQCAISMIVPTSTPKITLAKTPIPNESKINMKMNVPTNNHI